MPKRLNNQHTAKKRREEKRKLLKRRGISHKRVRKSQVSTQPASVAATATMKPQSVTKPPIQVQKTYELILIKGPEYEDQRPVWIESIKEVFNKTEAEARGIIFCAKYEEKKPTLFSSTNAGEIVDVRNCLAWSLMNATKIKE